MTDTKNLMAELRNLIEKMAKLNEKQGRELDERWGEDRDVPTKELTDYDDLCHDHLIEESDLLSHVHWRLIQLVEPEAAA
ncbi:hypothetical protein Q3V23_23425 [Streptomyces sp. VNUA116]|uniref:hypothetical protein n=1 Tax=Streptomyces sp. VNUA116 TaxID=3062449 RepID=UPI00267651CB|nr:hypothetical protein [Streptomyces sp. VNUA116]WKU46772.1 hypothetical protein Q3V23_23425 [Streptomyces sp. VNUA116]